MLRWYAALAILSRGSTTLGLLALSFIVDEVEYGLIGMAFIAITTASQIFGYPGYLTALNSGQDNQAREVRRVPLSLALAIGAFCFVLAFFWSQMASDHFKLLLIAALAAAALTASTTMNGVLQKLKYERFAAKNTGAFLVPFIAIAVPVSSWSGFESFVVAIFLAHSMALVTALRYTRTNGVEFGSLSLKYRDYVLFALSGLASSPLLLLAANLLFARGGASEMGQLTLALQVRAILIFGGGIAGAEMLSRYSDAGKSDGQLNLEAILSDLLSILKWLWLPILAAVAFTYAIDIEAYQPIFNRKSVYFMLASGAFVCASVPFSRALTVLYSEAWNVAVIFASSIVCVTALFLVPGNAESFSLVFALNSLMTLFFTIGVFIYLFRSRSMEC